MSVAHPSTTTSRTIPAFQPYECLICQSRFTRHENLKRHAKLHSRSQEGSLSCDLCQATFSRPDLRSRHMKKKHPDQEPRRGVTKRPLRRATAPRLGDHVSLSSDSSPESNDGFHLHHSGDEGAQLEADGGSGWTLHDNHAADQRADSSSSPEAQQPINESNHSIDRMVQDAISMLKPTFEMEVQQPASFDTNMAGGFDQGIVPGGLPVSNDRDESWLPSPSQITHGCDLFFNHLSHFVPFLHRPTFNAAQLPIHLVLSIVCLGYQHGEDPDSDAENAVSSANILSLRCFHRARALASASDEENSDTPSPSASPNPANTSLVQSYLLLEIYAMMYLCGDDSALGLRMHSSMISLARAGGLMQPMPPSEPSTTPDLETLWRTAINAESHKRTSFAVHQIDALWYQFLSMPRSISHLEVRHDLPCPEDQWSAPSAAEWAHRQLITSRPASPSVPYPDAVRRFLSSPDEITLSSLAIPPFDPYGAINITQFFISSAREVSGWSAMTGMLSMDRLDALRSSLLALGPFIRPNPTSPNQSPHATATWETAMIELHLWSPAHTGGVIASNLDTVLSQSTTLAPSYEFLWEADTAKAIQPHIDWFLRYLDTTVLDGDGEVEAPWVAVYAYKAFLIAWMLVRGGISGAMVVVGVADGDVEGALGWARGVFGRRRRWAIGRLVLGCLGGLGA